MLSLTAHPQSPYLLPRGPTSYRSTCSQSQRPEIKPLTRTLQIQTSASLYWLLLLSAEMTQQVKILLSLVTSSHCDMREPTLSKEYCFFLFFSSFNKGENVFCTQLEATVFYSRESTMVGVCEAAGSFASVVQKQEADAATQLMFSLYSLVYPKP